MKPTVPEKEKTISNLDITKFFSGSANTQSASQTVSTPSENVQTGSIPANNTPINNTPLSNGGFSQNNNSLDIPGFLQK